ncbi:MAG: hypothetical protein VKJ06_04305 [Vampirovibrionales bacterium]|nr:hypothetical protein [Vampirovibrionales bacterium]
MLALQPDFKGEVTGKLTPNGDFVMRVTFKDGSEQSFIADLLFMNQFAVCSHCNCLGQWQLAQ